MRVDTLVACDRPACDGTVPGRHWVPAIDVRPEQVHTVLISEVPAADPADDYYAEGDPLFARTTVQAFNDAGVPVASIRDILDLGVYLTTAVKCGKLDYGLPAPTINACCLLLERELALFPQARSYLLMGDVAIRSLNQIARRAGRARVVPAGSTYKIRGGVYHFGDVRVFPSYVQAGASFFIEKSKRRMIAEDITAAFSVAGRRPM